MPLLVAALQARFHRAEGDPDAHVPSGGGGGVSSIEYAVTPSDATLAFTAEAPQRATLPIFPSTGQVITAFDQANRADWRPKMLVDPVSGLVFVMKTAGAAGNLAWQNGAWVPDSSFTTIGNVAAPAAATGTTYYVSPSGSDTANNGTSSSTPWNTITKVNQTTLHAGDAVLFQGGATYNDSFLNPTWQGTQSAPIVIGAYGTGRPYLPQGVWFDGNQATWITLDRLIINSLQFGSGTLATNITAQRCEVFHVNPATGTSPGIITVGSNIKIIGCYLHDLGSHGIQPEAGSSTHTITGNLIYGIGLNPNGPPVTNGVGVNQHHMYLNGGAHTVTGNLCIGTLAQVLNQYASSAISTRGTNTTVDGNYFATVCAGVDYFDNDTTRGTLRVTNNTLKGIGTATDGYGFFATAGNNPLIENITVTGNVIEMVGTGDQINIHPSTGTVVQTPNTTRIGGSWNDPPSSGDTLNAKVISGQVATTGGGRIGGSWVLVDTTGMWGSGAGQVTDGTPLLIDGHDTAEIYAAWPSVGASRLVQAFAVPWGTRTFSLATNGGAPLTATVPVIFCTGPWTAGGGDLYGLSTVDPKANNPRFFGGANPRALGSYIYPQASNGFGAAHGFMNAQGPNVVWGCHEDAVGTSATFVVEPGIAMYQLPAVTMYNAATIYAAGAVVMDGNGDLWTSRVAGNVGNTPSSDGGVHWTASGGTGDCRYEFNAGDNFGAGQPWMPKASGPWGNGVDPVATWRKTVPMVFSVDVQLVASYQAPGGTGTLSLTTHYPEWCSNLAHRGGFPAPWSGTSDIIAPTIAQWKSLMASLSNFWENHGPAVLTLYSGTNNGVGSYGGFQVRYQPTAGGNQNLTILTWDLVDLHADLGLVAATPGPGTDAKRCSNIVEQQNGHFSTSGGTPYLLDGIPAGWSTSLQARLAFAYDSVDGWNATSTYAAGAIRVGSDHNYYTSQVAANKGNDPTTDNGTHWARSTNGVSYENATTYGLNAAVTGSDKLFYLSMKAGNVGNNPTTDSGTNWLRAQFPVVGVPRDSAGNIIAAGQFGGSFLRTWRDIEGAGNYICTSAEQKDADGNYISVPGTPTYNPVTGLISADPANPTYGLDAGKIFCPTNKGNSCRLKVALAAGDKTIPAAKTTASLASTGFWNNPLGYGTIVDPVNGNEDFTWSSWTSGGGFTGINGGVGLAKPHGVGCFIHGIIEGQEHSPGVNQGGKAITVPGANRMWALRSGEKLGDIAVPYNNLP